MCTILLFLFISRLANGITMGNRTSTMKMDRHSKFGSENNLHTIISEEDYIPMPRSMRKSLLKGRKFQRVLPSAMNHNCDRTDKEESVCEVTRPSNVDFCVNYELYDSNIQNTVPDNNVKELDKDSPVNSMFKITPIVTLFDVDEKSKSLPNARIGDESDKNVSFQDSSPRTNHITNRKYSLINLKTGLEKSEFTLALEDKLRESKRQLGFDGHLSEWKEFSFKDERSKEDGFKKQSLERGMKTKSLEFSSRNCQILGLCSVGRPKAFPNDTRFHTVIFPDELSTGDAVNKSHSKKEACPCDLCTLAFLTGMNCHGGRTSSKPKSVNSLPRSDRTNRVVREKIRITDNENGKKSIEISVRSVSPDTKSNFINNSSNSSRETNQDITNSRIRRKFKKNEVKVLREIYTNTNSTYSDFSVPDLESNSLKHADNPPPSPKFINGSASNNRNKQSLKHKHRKQSSSTMSASFTSTSSLSTVLSYRRVRQIFETMIEGARGKKRPKLDRLKFKEMEELGLGRFRNNRWYPSDYKTLSIWKALNESAHGVQGEFKKYHKTTNKT